MKQSLKTGFSFGLTSGIITTLGLMVGLFSGTHSQLVIIGGILTIAIADSASDALGIHVSEEAEGKKCKSVWESTFSTFITKFIFAITFIVPILLFELQTAIWISVVWGLGMLSFFSFKIAEEKREKAWKVIVEHIFIAVIVIIVTYYVGVWVSANFV